MTRIRFIPVVELEETPACWNCGQQAEGPLRASFLYRRHELALLEEWRKCECGAYQNSVQTHRIEVEPVGKGA